MTSAPYWIRVVQLTVGGFHISGPKIVFAVRFDATGDPPSGVAKVYNLNQSTEKALVESSEERVVLTAGYGTTASAIFDGFAQRVLVQRERLERVTVVEMVSKLATTRATKMDRSWKGTHKIRDIVEDLARNEMGLVPTNLNVISDDLILENFKWTGQPRFALDKVLQSLVPPYRAVADGDSITFYLVEDAVQPPASIHLSPQTGMIGTPQEQEEGKVTVRSLLQPAVKIDDAVDIRSEFLSGVFRVVALAHRGDNWDGEFITIIGGEAYE